MTTKSGLVPLLQAEVEEAANAYVLEAVERMSSGEYMHALGTLDEYSLGRKTAAELGAAFDEVVYRSYTAVVDSGDLPDRLLVDSFSWIHPANFDGFDALPLPRQHTIVDAYQSVLSGIHPPSYLFERLEPELFGQFTSRLDEWRAGRVLNTFFSGFRPRVLSEGFARYRSMTRAPYNAVQWAISRMRGRYAEALQLEIGSDFRELLRRVDPEKLWQVSDTALEHFLKLHDKPDFYIDLRKLNSGFGLLFEIDHGIEYRFWRGFPGFEDFHLPYDHVQSLLVAKNPIVASQLPQDAVFYAHSVKTTLLARLIPHGAEAAYTLQEVLDAHTIVFIYQLKVPYELYSNIVLDTFVDLANELDVTLDLTLTTLDQLQRRNPSFRVRPP